MRTISFLGVSNQLPTPNQHIITLAHHHIGTLAHWHIGTLAHWHIGTLAHQFTPLRLSSASTDASRPRNRL